MPNPRREERRKYCRRTTEFLSATLGANSVPHRMDSLHHQQPSAILLDLDGFEILQPFGIDKATLISLRGSLGRKPERATQAKVRARQKNKKNNKKKGKKCKE
ncbi:hypothetical protein HYC85_027691 [Camellia sinensis]|uniref:Uncharacterized protein n=1 Tax=Camellia sinensis TaxID=4442 RepID=A0A7J7FT06_CAMSI|nr:hypothetical protein HYC85_027691 [Camellia sinensis]